MTVVAGPPVDMQVTTPDVVLYVRDDTLGDPKINKNKKNLSEEQVVVWTSSVSHSLQLEKKQGKKLVMTESAVDDIKRVISVILLIFKALSIFYCAKVY